MSASISWMIVYLSVASVSTTPSSHFMSALRQVESGDRDGLVIGDKGRSIGPYQISYAYWKDSGVSGSWRQCLGRAYSERVMRAYWRRHCPEALASGNWQTLARVHNGGPRGHVRSGTLDYWQRVRTAVRSAADRESQVALNRWVARGS